MTRIPADVPVLLSQQDILFTHSNLLTWWCDYLIIVFPDFLAGLELQKAQNKYYFFRRKLQEWLKTQVLIHSRTFLHHLTPNSNANGILALLLAARTDFWQKWLTPCLPWVVITWEFFHWICDLLSTSAGNLRGQRARLASSNGHVLLPSTQLFQALCCCTAVKPDLERSLSSTIFFPRVSLALLSDARYKTNVLSQKMAIHNQILTHKEGWKSHSKIAQYLFNLCMLLPLHLAKVCWVIWTYKGV